eukprot:gene10213-12524_t
MWETSIVFTIDNSIQKPTVVFTLTKGSAEFKDVISHDSNKGEITIGDFSSTDGSISSSNKTAVSFSLLLFGLIGSLFIPKFSSKSTIFIILCIVSVLIANANSLKVEELAVKVDIRTPSSFQFNSLAINLGAGSSTLNGIQTNSLKIDACQGKSSSIDLENASLSNLNICSQEIVNVKTISIPSSNSVIKITTTKSANLSFQNAYRGKLSVTSTSDPIISGDCTISREGDSVFVGTCNGGSSSEITISAPQGAKIGAGSASECLTDPSWREPDASSASTPSPPITTTNPETLLPMKTNDDWRIMSSYDYEEASLSMATGTSNGVDVSNTLKFSLSEWGPPIMNWVLRRPAVALKAGRQYFIDFGFLLGQTQVTHNKILKFSVILCPRIDTNAESGWLPDNYPTYFTQTVQGDWSSTNAWVQKSISFTPTSDIGDASLMLRFEFAGQSGDLPAKTLFFKNLVFRIPSSPVVTPTLLDKDSELIIIPKPSPTFDAQDRTKCPHRESGLKHWHDPATWGGSVPTPSSTITLPENTKVLVSSCSMSSTQVYQKIIIPSTSSLIFTDADMTINVKDIFVNGTLFIGSQLCRYNAKINIIFHGDRVLTDTIAPFYGSKGIGSSAKGFISINGKQYHNTWTKLAATAWPGDRVIYIQDSVNWEVGQQVVITTSHLHDDQDNDQNEVLTIEAIQGKIVQFTQSLKFLHYGGKEYQSEVGLLSRRIVLKGADDSNTGKFGGHVMMMGEGQISGVQLIQMGQQNIKARYPLHFHLAKTLTKSYISDCSVYDCYYRCYTIHGTNNVLVTRNVAYKTFGHCYYLEDGVEENNTLSYNLAARVNTIGRPAAGPSQRGEIFDESDTLRQPADCAAGGFYITNAYNRIIGNAASGGWAGFSFPNLYKPIGNHQSVNLDPSSRPTLEFNGNSAHSSGYSWEASGGIIYVGGNLSVSTVTQKLVYHTGRTSRNTNLYGADVWMKFTNTKVFLGNSGINHWGERIEAIGIESHDCHRPATLFGQAWLSNGIINGQSGNPLSKKTSYPYDRQGFQFYDTHVQTVVTKIDFRNFIHNPDATGNPEQDNRVIISMTHSDIYKPQGISITKEIKYQNVATSQIIGHGTGDTGSARFFNFIDSDGSATKRGKPTLVGSHMNWWNFDSTCSYVADWLCYVCDKTNNNEVGNIELTVPGYIEWKESSPLWNVSDYVGYANLFGTGFTNGDRRATPFTRNPGITGVISHNSNPNVLGWYLFFKDGKTPTTINLKIMQVPLNYHILMAIPYPAGTTFSIKARWEWDYGNPPRYNRDVTATTSVELVRSAARADKYYFDGKHLYLKLINIVADGSPDEYFERDGVRLNIMEWGVYYNILATCTSSTGGFCPSVVDTLPSI